MGDVNRMVEGSKLRNRQEDLDRINSMSDLIEFAVRNSEVHKVFYHYTTVKGLLGILDSKILRLSIGSSMNDMQEITKGNFNIWERTFVSSFSYGDNENIAMWSMYSLPWEQGVRITIPGKVLKKWVSEVIEVFGLDENNNVTEKVKTRSIQLTDVLYSMFDEKENTEKIKLDNYRIINSIEQLKLSNPSSEKCVTGFMKNKAWEFENETRIRIETIDNQHIKRVGIRIPDYVLDSFEITTSPWFNSTLKLKNLRYHDLKIKESMFKDLVKLKTICETCVHDYFGI